MAPSRALVRGIQESYPNSTPGKKECYRSSANSIHSKDGVKSQYVIACIIQSNTKDDITSTFQNFTIKDSNSLLSKKEKVPMA